jgi:hypothetical protein
MGRIIQWMEKAAFIALKGNHATTAGHLTEVGSRARDFQLIS